MKEDLTTLANSLGYSYDDFMARPRSWRVSMARQAVWYLLYRDHRITFEDIGRLFGLNYSTVIYGVKKIKDYVSIQEPHVLQLLERADKNALKDIANGIDY